MTATHDPTANAPQERAPSAGFQVHRLGPGIARDINTRGEIVGVVDDEAAVWRRGTPSRLPNPLGGPSGADAINGHGVIAGRAGDGPDAKVAIWQPGSFRVLLIEEGPPLGVSINNHGHVAGTITDVPDYGYAFVWTGRRAEPLNLPAHAGGATDINDRGQVVGHWWEDEEVAHPYVWQAGTFTALLELDGPRASASAINNAGVVVGGASRADGRSVAVRWDEDGLHELGTLGGRWSAAHAINGRGDIVGASETASGAQNAFLWRHGVMTDLGPDSSIAYSVNDRLEIAGSALRDAVSWTRDR